MGLRCISNDIIPKNPEQFPACIAMTIKYEGIILDP